MNALGVYRPGNSVLHRLPAAVKLVALAVSITVISLTVRTLPALGAAVGFVVVVFALGGIGPVTAFRQLRPMAWVLGLIFVLQWIFTDLVPALALCGVLLCSVALAAALTLTTRTDDMVDTLIRAMGPLRRFGFPVDHLAMALALTIRAIPLMAEIVGQVNEARRARGLRPGPRILVAPIVIGALRTADGFAETLTARGLD